MPKLKDKTTVTDRIATSKADLLIHLKKIPIVQIACERAGTSRATFYRWCQDDGEFAQQAQVALSEGKSMVNDLAESQLISGIKDKSFSAISFWLKHNHPDYGQRLELSGQVSVSNDALSEEQEILVKQALLNAGLIEKETES